jgi:hypothetical protein
MIKVAKKFNTNLAVIRIMPQLSAQLPAWYHLSAEPRAINTATAKCLIEKHQTYMVAELMGASARIRSPSQDDLHRPSTYCLCRPCKVDREKDCINPNECTLEAKRRIELIPPKLNPMHQSSAKRNLVTTALSYLIMPYRANKA